ncbi:MAG: hypothetical protein AAGI50_09655 [Pseudomonadota bacterium]
MVQETRDHATAAGLLWKALGSNSVPARIVIDNIRSDKAGLNTVGDLLCLLCTPPRIEIIQAKYLNRIVASSIV